MIFGGLSGGSSTVSDMDTPGASPVTVKDAPLDALPQVLVDPPWEQAARLPSPAKPKEPEPVLVPGLEPPAGLTIAWKPGEREEWAAITSYGHFDGDWAAIIEEYREPGAGYPPTKAGLLVQGPEELVRPLVAAWRPEYTSSYFWHSLRPIVARFELEAHAPLIHCVDLDPMAASRRSCRSWTPRWRSGWPTGTSGSSRLTRSPSPGWSGTAWRRSRSWCRTPWASAVRPAGRPWPRCGSWWPPRP